MCYFLAVLTGIAVYFGGRIMVKFGILPASFLRKKEPDDSAE